MFWLTAGIVRLAWHGSALINVDWGLGPGAWGCLGGARGGSSASTESSTVVLSVLGRQARRSQPLNLLNLRVGLVALYLLEGELRVWYHNNGICEHS